MQSPAHSIQPWVEPGDSIQTGYVEFRESPTGCGIYCLWLLSGRPWSETFYKAIPDGLSDLIVDFRTGRSWLSGSLSAAIDIPILPQSKYAGVRFNPLFLSAITGIDAFEFTDRMLEFTPKGKLAEAIDRACDCRFDNRSRTLLIRTILSIVESKGYDFRLPKLWKCFLETENTINEIAQLAGLCQRQLHRVCCRDFGSSPKHIQRVMRLQKAMVSLALAEQQLASIAAAAGYADQSHMSREFKSLTGHTPNYWLRRKNVRFVQESAALKV